jgi:hypothetical protein
MTDPQTPTPAIPPDADDGAHELTDGDPRQGVVDDPEVGAQ